MLLLRYGDTIPRVRLKVGWVTARLEPWINCEASEGEGPDDRQWAVAPEVDGWNLVQAVTRMEVWCLCLCVHILYIPILGCVPFLCPLFWVHLVFLVDEIACKNIQKYLIGLECLPIHPSPMERSHTFKTCCSRTDSLICSLSWESSNVPGETWLGYIL